MNVIDEYNNENPFGIETESDFHMTRKDFTISIIEDLTKDRSLLNILDVGCGTGIITKSIRFKFPQARIDAIDISNNAISKAVSTNENINYQVEDAFKFNGYGYSYDIIILNNIYEHVSNPTDLIANLKNLLNENGYIIISTPNRYHIRNVLRKFLGLNIHIPSYHITEYSIGQLSDHHVQAGLIILKYYFPNYKREKFRIIDFLAFNIMKPLLEAYFRAMKSRIRLGSLMFVVSKKKH